MKIEPGTYYPEDGTRILTIYLKEAEEELLPTVAVQQKAAQGSLAIISTDSGLHVQMYDGENWQEV